MRMLTLLTAAYLAGGLADAALLAASDKDTASKTTSTQPSGDDRRNADSFTFGQPIIGTTYFYPWDVYSGAGLVDPDGTDALTTHPPRTEMADFSFRSVRWHRQQLNDIRSAGIDFVMCVYSAPPDQKDHWCIVGLQTLVEAYEQAEADPETENVAIALPKIAMFYDLAGLADPGPVAPMDLTTREGQVRFYETIHDFFSLVPPRAWARIDGKPIMFLSPTQPCTTINETLFDEARERFKADFDTDFFLVRHDDWPGRADAWYIWGGAKGLKMSDLVASLGPGYDDSGVCGRTPVVVDRNRGAFYTHQWERLLCIHPKYRPWIVHIETWNNFREGTNIARSQKNHDFYIKLTAKFARVVHAGYRLDAYGPYVNAKQVRWTARHVSGLNLKASVGDGCWERTDVGNSPAVVSVAGRSPSDTRYLYFDIDDSCVFGDRDLAAELTVVFRDDGGCQSFHIEYDSSDSVSSDFGGAYRPSRQVTVGHTNAWRSVVMQLPQVWFCNRTGDADLRIAVQGGDQRLTIREVIVRKLPGKLKALATSN